jgi:hypothetical protein
VRLGHARLSGALARAQVSSGRRVAINRIEGRPRMKKVCLLLLVALTAGGVAPAALAAEALPTAPALPALASTPGVVSPALQALEQKMGELRITSLRFSERTSITISHRDKQLRPLLKLLKALGDTGLSGEATITPPAGDFTLDFFGHPFELRVVSGTTYLYISALAPHDHGRPWIKLGPAGLGELIKVKVDGKSPSKPVKTATPPVSTPALAEPPFAKLKETLAKATEIRELGAGTLYGQPVMSFLAVLEPEALKSEPLASTALRRPPGQPSSRPSPQPSPATLEVSFAESGLPVRIVIRQGSGGVTTLGTLEIPAINFPLTIEAPPAAQTIGLAQLRALERRLKAKERRGRRAKDGSPAGGSK